MNFGDAAAKIVDRVNRADKLQAAKDGINDAIATFATRPFVADLASATLTLVSSTYEQSFDTTVSPFARFRKVKWIRPSGYRKYVVYRDPAKIFQNGCETRDVYYVEGVNLIFKLSALQSTAAIAYYQYHTQLEDDIDEDWMLDKMWPAVRAYALSSVFGEIGDDAERARYEKEYLLKWSMFHADLGDGTEP